MQLTSNCDPPISTKWKVINVDDNEVLQVENGISQTTKTFKNNTMDPGHYKVCLDMIYEAYGSNNAHFEDCMFINFTLPALVADFHVNNKDAPFVVQVSLHDDLILSSSSYDLAADLPSVAGVSSSIEWNCIKGVSFTQNDIDNYFPDLIMPEGGVDCSGVFTDISKYRSAHTCLIMGFGTFYIIAQADLCFEYLFYVYLSKHRES